MLDLKILKLKQELYRLEMYQLQVLIEIIIQLKYPGRMVKEDQL